MHHETTPLSEQHHIVLKRRVLSPKGLCIGLLAGLTAVAFRLSLEYAENLRNIIISLVQSRGFLYWCVPPVAFAGSTALVVWVTLKYVPEASGSGIPHLKGHLQGLLPFRGWPILLVKFFGGIIGIGGGLALGREGPTVQMGAAVARITGGYLAPNRSERNILISAGAGAGLAAAFNAPLAGVFFVMEELQSSLNRYVLVTAFVACVTADIVCRLIMGHLPVFHITITRYPHPYMFPFFLVMGLFLGYLGLVFNQTILAASVFWKQYSLPTRVWMAACLGIVLGLAGLAAPETIGSGTELTEKVLGSSIAAHYLLIYFLLRFAFTMASYSTGAPGGIFAPLLLLGVLSGSLFGHLVHIIYPETGFDFAVWGVLGMAGYFSAIVRAPITGTILILEMTGSYDLLLPLMIISIISYSIPEYYRDKPVYEALLEQSLRGRPANNPGINA